MCSCNIVGVKEQSTDSNISIAANIDKNQIANAHENKTVKHEKINQNTKATVSALGSSSFAFEERDVDAVPNNDVVVEVRKREPEPSVIKYRQHAEVRSVGTGVPTSEGKVPPFFLGDIIVDDPKADGEILDFSIS